MTRIRALLAVFIMTCGLLLGSMAVFAAEIQAPELSANGETVRKGQEIEFVFSLDGYDDIKTGINTVKGTLEYDPAIFEEPGQEHFEPLNSWENVYFNPDNGQFVLMRRASSLEGGDVLRVTLTAKEDLPAKDTYVRVSGLSASEGKGDLFPKDVEVKLSAVSGQRPGDSGSNTGGQTKPEIPEDTEDKPVMPEPPADIEEEPVHPVSPGNTEEPAQPGNPTDIGQIKPENIGNIKEPVQLESPVDTEEEGLEHSESAEEEQSPQESPADTEEGQAQPDQEEEPAEGEEFIPGISIFVLCVAVVLLIAIIVGIVLKKKGRTGGMRMFSGVILAALTMAFAASAVYAFGGKGDLNEDGAVDYTDVVMLKKHLIALEPLPEDKWNAADMNSDGTLTVTDLSLLIQKIEKTVDYEVAITPAMDRFYFEKHEEIALKFYAQVSYGAEIERVTVNGAEYEVQKTEGGSEYTVQLPAVNTPGVQAFHITKVSLNSGQEVEVDYTETIDVLKTTPSVEMFLAEEMVDTAQMKVSFLLQDEDSALTSSEMEVLKSTDGTFTTVDVMDVTAGENVFLLDLEEDTAYTLHISAQYNRDSDELEVEEDHSGSFAVMKEIQLKIDYQFSFGNMKVQTEDRIDSEKFEKNQPIVLWFESSNATKFRPERIVVNGNLYPVAQSGNGYSATLDGFTQTGKTEIKVEQVILENGKAFSLEKDHAVTVTIQKESPAITNLSVREEAEKGQFQVAFQLADPDGALSDRKIQIQNADGKLVGEQSFEADDLQEGAYSGTVTLTDTGLTTSYTVQIVADCDLSLDGSATERQKVLAEQEIDAQLRALVTAGKAGADYAEKGGDVELFYEISDNVEAELSRVVVNNVELPAVLQQSGRWKVTAAAPEKAGEQKFTLSQLVFADGSIVNVNHNLSVEVMKSAPAVEDYETEDILEKDQVKFRFVLTDTDRSFLSGKIQLISDAGSIIVAEEVIPQAGEQAFTLDVEEQKEYTFRVLLSWKETEDGSRQVTDEIVFEKTVYMVRDYGLKLSGIKALSADGSETVYFEPGNAVKLRFRAETLTNLAAERVQMNGSMYDLTPLEKDVYEFTANAGSQPGVQDLIVETLVMENGKELPVENGNSIPVEVLKAVPKVDHVTSEKTVQDELKVQLSLKDPDGALQSAQVQIAEEGGNVLLTQPISVGTNEATAELTEAERYVVRVTADFDRDTNAFDDQSNAYQDEELYVTSVEVSRDAIQFKDVTDTKLYHREGGNTQEVTILDITGGLPADVEKYYAVIEMEGLPDFYAGIEEFRRDADSGRVYAVIDQKDVILYREDGTRQNEYAFPLVYRDATGVHPLVTSAEELFRQMAANPNGRFTLTEDLDASGISANAAAIAGTFTGELDGNGYKILNLPTVLFNRLSGAKIHDLVIENAQITTSHSGILANVIQNQSVVERVFIVNSSISNGVDELGAFAGNLNNATIRESASVDVSVKGLVAVGGIVGKTSTGAVIENCYAAGKVQGTYDHPTLGARVAGIAGWHGGGEIRHCFTQVQVTAPAKKGNGGIIGGPNTGNPVIENCLSMSTGAGYRIAGFDVLENAKNVYEYSGSDSATNITETNRDQVKETDAIFDRSFYRDDLGLDEKIWNLDLLAYGKRPDLKAAPNMDNNYGIPNYAQVLAHADYKPEREQAYANMAKLMPFSDIRTWMEYGNRLSDTDPLVVQAVQFVLPLDGNGSLVSGMHRDTLSEVQKIRIVFEKERMKEYAVSWQKTMGNVIAAYRVEGTDMMYQFHHYVANLSEALLEDAVNLVSAYDYATDIAALTNENESRLYVDYYNESVKPAIGSLVRKLLYSQEAYPTYCTNAAVQKLVRERIRDEDAWKKLLYGYNYYDKWYRIDYSGVNLSDLLFFNGELIAQGMTAPALSEKLLAVAPDQRETHRTVVFYNQVLKNYTEKPLMDFLGDLSDHVAGYDNPSDWFADNFDGILKEQEAHGGAAGIRYRIWDILCGLDDRRKSIVLPILTAPQEDMYLISLPSQMMLGSMNRYTTYLNKDGNERERMQEIIDVYAEKMGIFYSVSSAWMSDSASQLNSFVNIQYDTRLNFPESEAAAAGDQDKDKTRDPVMKWVYEANNTISAKNGSAAFADGSNVYWVWDPALGTSDYTFFTFSHETAHNQDGRYFYGGAGRREGTGAEAHADGNIAQEMRDGCMVFNISKINDMGVEMTNNFSYERIDSAEKIESYYREMFETGYVLDYLAAKAFLNLTVEQQAAVAVQAAHIPGGNASFSTVYSDVSVEELKQMGLKDIEDLWANRISIRNLTKGSTEKISTATDGSYGFESFYYMNWYQSHNDNGSPDTHAFKRLGMEMLGVGGYEGGYRLYMSALSKNDLDALQKITGNPNITWKEYKLSRFKAVEDNLDRIPYFDAETVIEQFQAAFEKDAQNGTRKESIAVKRMLYGIVKRATGDFSDGSIYQSPSVIPVTSAEELIRLARENPYGYYKLEADLDFSGIAAAQGSYIPERFIGILDGNGHKLTGMQHPLFGDLQYAQVKNLTIAEPTYTAGVQAVLAVKTRQVVVGDVTLDKMTVAGTNQQIPLVKTKSDAYYEYGTIHVTLES